MSLNRSNDKKDSHTNLLKANIVSILPEASSANVQSIFAYNSMMVAAHSTIKNQLNQHALHCKNFIVKTTT